MDKYKVLSAMLDALIVLYHFPSSVEFVEYERNGKRIENRSKRTELALTQAIMDVAGIPGPDYIGKYRDYFSIVILTASDNGPDKKDETINLLLNWEKIIPFPDPPDTD